MSSFWFHFVQFSRIQRSWWKWNLISWFLGCFRERSGNATELSDTWRWRGSVTICAKLLLRPLCLRAQWRSWISTTWASRVMLQLPKHQPARGRQAYQHALLSEGELVDYDLWSSQLIWSTWFFYFIRRFWLDLGVAAEANCIIIHTSVALLHTGLKYWHFYNCIFDAQFLSLSGIYFIHCVSAVELYLHLSVLLLYMQPIRGWRTSACNRQPCRWHGFPAVMALDWNLLWLGRKI